MPNAAQFLRDFAALEEELRRKNKCPAERIVVEFALTPKRIRELEKKSGFKVPWFAPVYKAMIQHGLHSPGQTSWAKWLSQYKAQRKRIARTPEGRLLLASKPAKGVQRLANKPVQPKKRVRDMHSASDRLAGFLRSKQAIPYVENAEDREFPYVKLTIWGVAPTNELFVRLSNGESEFVGSVPSSVNFPGMGDRIFGMDVDDARIAYSFAEVLLEKHKKQLIRKRI